MKVTVEGIEQGAIEIEVEILPRQGELIRIFYGPDAEIKGEVQEVYHIVNQHDNEQKVIITIRPSD